MDVLLEKSCDEFIAYRDILRDMTFFHSYAGLYPACAYIYMARHEEPNEEMIRLCREILHEDAGIFSMFRGNGEKIFTALLATERDPGTAMELCHEAYEILRSYFSASNYLPMLAFYMMSVVPENRYEDFVSGTRDLFDTLNRDHPLLTSSEDVVFSGLLHKTGKPHEMIADEAEAIFSALTRRYHFHKDAMQTVSHALTMCSGDPEDKLNRLYRLVSELEEEGYRYSRDFEMVPLALLANMGIETSQIVRDFIEVEQFLSDSEGYGFFGGFSTRTRYMHAVLVLSAYYMTYNPELTMSFVISVLVEIERIQAAAAAAAA